MLEISKREAGRFLLYRHGLLGSHKYKGKQGALRFVTERGCVQYDPVDICGRNADIVLSSRVKGYRKDMLWELLYKDRVLVDHYDKMMSVFSMSDWPLLARNRKGHTRNAEAIGTISPEILTLLKEKAHVSSSELGDGAKVISAWGHSVKLEKAALEHLYYTGALMIHHKEGTFRHFCLPETLEIPEISRPDPNESDGDYFIWQLKRRILSVGLLQNRPSDAFLGLRGFGRAERNAAFSALLDRGEIAPLSVEGSEYYMPAGEAPDMEQAQSRGLKKRAELIAPLDNLIWDRRMIKDIFGFEYKWEIYTPQDKRKYSYYVLPVIYGDRFVGRIAPIADRKRGVLTVKAFWAEKGFTPLQAFKEALAHRLKDFAAFNNCTDVEVLCEI